MLVNPKFPKAPMKPVGGRFIKLPDGRIVHEDTGIVVDAFILNTPVGAYYAEWIKTNVVVEV